MRTATIVAWMIIPLAAGCATIPRESVELSARVGTGIGEQHQAGTKLINLYFDASRSELDRALIRAVSDYFATLTPDGQVTLTRAQLDDVATDIAGLNRRNNEAREELEKARQLVLSRLNDRYLALSQANASVTGLLQSAVTVKSTRSKAFRDIADGTGGDLDLEAIVSQLDGFVAKAGTESGKAIKLVDEVQRLVDGDNDKDGAKQ
jgi:hypothetical protein